MTEDAGNHHDRAIDPDRIVPHDANESIPIAPVAGLIPIIVPVGSERATDTGFAAAVDTAVETAIETAVDPVPEVRATPAALPVPAGWSDPVTGNDGPAFWDRIVLTEHARVRRYKRPATIAFVEVVGLDSFALKWGPAIAQRLLVRIGRTLAQEIRSSDCSARIEPSRFGVLLTETDEIAAINFVERARVACEAQINRAGPDLRIGIGWSSLSSKDLGDALDTAAARLAADLERDG